MCIKLFCVESEHDELLWSRFQAVTNYIVQLVALCARLSRPRPELSLLAFNMLLIYLCVKEREQWHWIHLTFTSRLKRERLIHFVSDVRINSNMHQHLQGICTLLPYFHHLFILFSTFDVTIMLSNIDTHGS